MRALVISPRLPPSSCNGDFGIERRLRLFIEALGQVCEHVSFVYLVPKEVAGSINFQDYAPEKIWNVPGDSAFAPLAQRSETFMNHYLAGAISVNDAPVYFPYLGQEIVLAIKSALSAAPDIVFVDQLHAMLPLLATRQTKIPMLFDLNDLLHKVHWRSLITPPFHIGKLGYAMHIPALFAAEYRAIKAASVTAVCAEADRVAAARICPGQRTVVVSNAVDCPSNPPSLSKDQTLLFLGNYTYEPNVQAAERLVHRIWPRILQACPGARLFIAGGSIGRLPSAKLSIAGVDYLGFVPDLNQLYARTRVVCCPLDVGGGTRLKLIEAAAYGRPMVSTRVGAEGLVFRNGVDILLRDKDAEFADACVTLFGDIEHCSQLGAAARVQMQANYDARSVRSQIVNLVRSIIANDQGGR